MNIYDIFQKLNIEYAELEHKAVYTVEEAKNEAISKKLNGIECKNLFVKSKSKYYLIVIKAFQKANLKEISMTVKDSKLTFATEQELKEILNLTPGSVTPLGIINDSKNLVTICLDHQLIKSTILIHPNINTKTVAVKTEDLIRLLEYENHSYIVF